MKPTAVILGIAFASALSQAHSDSWNQFRGPNGSGVAKDSRPPVKLDDAQLAWKAALPPGLSSPVLSGKRIFLTGLAKGRLVTHRNQQSRRQNRLAKSRHRRSNSKRFTRPATPLSPQCSLMHDRVFHLLRLIRTDLLRPRRAGNFGKNRSPHPRHFTVCPPPLSSTANISSWFWTMTTNLPGSQLSQSKVVAYDKTNGDDRLGNSPSISSQRLVHSDDLEAQ